MSIRLKIIFVVLPLVIVTLLLAGTASYFQAASGITRVTKEFLDFKAFELEKYAQSQWDLLVENNFTDRPEMVLAAQQGIESFARSIIRSTTEILIAFTEDGQVVMRTTPLEVRPEEVRTLQEIARERKIELLTPVLGGIERVAKGFYFPPFQWYFLITEEKNVYYRDVDKITQQTIYIMVAASLAAILMLLLFTNILMRPLVRVVNTMQGIIRSGDLSHRVEVEYQDEIGTLSHTFNLMIAELERAYKQIKRYAFEAVLAQKKEERIRHIFQKYVPQDLIDQFFAHPESMLVGDNRVLSILFSDIRSFTTISEAMAPDDLVNSLNRYFTVMVDIIMNRNGIIDKYIGDAIMAFWGAPVKHEDDALQSVLAGLDMLEAVKEFNKHQKEIGKPEFKIGIGINYGVVTVGNIGCERKMDYTVIGDMVNLASRMEGLTKTYHQEILISESLHMKVKDHLPWRLLDTVAVKGKTRGVKIYTVRRSLTPEEQKRWTLHNEGMELYYARKFEEAQKKFQF
ncbi:MAG: adenylate/guanylate cyclase domain-containing protein, partial [Spirochaetales bacterium]